MKNWPKIIAHVDMDAFFASIEQRDFPELKGRPVAVTNGLKGNCIITCSYEARQWGVKTGLRFREAKQLCPSLIQRSARPQQYAQISKAILDSLTQLTPDIEVERTREDIEADKDPQLDRALELLSPSD